MRLLLRASAPFIVAAEVPGLTMTNWLRGRATPRAFPETQVVPSAFERTAGTKTFHAPRRSTTRNGFSRITGAASMVVYGGSGKLFVGARSVPTNTMFQFDPFQLPSALLRVSHCCWLPDLTCPSTFESARNPPLDQPPSSSTRSPRMCMRRIGAACDTAHRSKPPTGFTDIFSAMRQKFSVAFPFLQRASALIPPLMTTSFGESPSPDTWV